MVKLEYPLQKLLMSSLTQKAKIAQVPFGATTIEGLMLPDGSFGVSFQQAASLFSVLPNSAQKDFKRLLGEGFQFCKYKVERESRQNRQENILTLDQFDKILVELALRGNKSAQELLRALVGLSLTQIFSDAFGVKFEAAERQAWLKARLKGMETRRTLTDAIKDYITRHPDLCSENYAKFVYSNISDCLNRAVLGETAKSYCESKGIDRDKLRDSLDEKVCTAIDHIENHAMMLIDRRDREPMDAMRDVLALRVN